jgi:hypothetical protein
MLPDRNQRSNQGTKISSNFQIDSNPIAAKIEEFSDITIYFSKSISSRQARCNQLEEEKKCVGGEESTVAILNLFNRLATAT